MENKTLSKQNIFSRTYSANSSFEAPSRDNKIMLVMFVKNFGSGWRNNSVGVWKTHQLLSLTPYQRHHLVKPIISKCLPFNHLMVDSNLKLLNNGATRVCEIAFTLDFTFRLMLCSREDVSFSNNCLNMLEDIYQPYFLVRFQYS